MAILYPASLAPDGSTSESVQVGGAQGRMKIIRSDSDFGMLIPGSSSAHSPIHRLAPCRSFHPVPPPPVHDSLKCFFEKLVTGVWTSTRELHDAPSASMAIERRTLHPGKVIHDSGVFGIRMTWQVGTITSIKKSSEG